MTSRRLAVALLAPLLLLIPATAFAQGASPPAAPAAPGGPKLGLGWRLQAGAVHQFDSSLDGGGNYDATRAVIDGGVRYAFSPGTSVGLSVGYGYETFDFSDGARIEGVRPWDRVQSLRLSLPLFWEPAPGWQVLAIPNLRVAGERTNAWSDGLTGGAILGFSYRFSDRLRIGPGFGITSEIEEDVNFFPIVIIDWRITDKLRIETGPGLGATRGPGVSARYQIAKHWDASLGFRYEKNRFRLRDETGGGVGQERSFPVLVGLTWGPPYAQVSLVAGVEVGGELRIEDSRGRRIASSDYDPAPFLGLTGRIRF